MEATEQIQCPYCGQASALVIDRQVDRQSLITDCEVCCRPMEVVIRCEEGEILSLEARAN